MTAAFPEATLATERLVIRPFTETDAPDLAGGTADPQNLRWVYFGKRWTVEQARAWCTGRAREDFATGARAWFALAERASGAFAGLLVMKDADWHHGTVEVGYWLAARVRGRGYAAEAVREACRWVFALGFVRVELKAAAANRPSVAVAERAGFTFEGRLRAADAPLEPGGARLDLLTFALLAPGAGAGEAPPRFPDVRLATRRLRLRPFTPADQPALLAAMADAESARWLSVPQPYTPQMAGQWCGDLAHQLRISGEGIALAAVLAGDGSGDGAGDGAAAAGDGFVGSFTLQRTSWRNLVTEAGYVVAPAMRGRGYATEALAELARWALRDQGFARVELRAAAGNAASHRVAEKAGFVREGLLRGAGHTESGRVDLLLYGITAPAVEAP